MPQISKKTSTQNWKEVLAMDNTELLLKQRESIILTGLICSRCRLSWINCKCHDLDQDRSCDNCCWYRDDRCLLKLPHSVRKDTIENCSDFVAISSAD